MTNSWHAPSLRNAHVVMPGDAFRNVRQGLPSGRIVQGDGVVVIACLLRRDWRREASLPCRLVIPTVTRHPHAIRTPSRTKWRRINRGRVMASSKS